MKPAHVLIFILAILLSGCGQNTDISPQKDTSRFGMMAGDAALEMAPSAAMQKGGSGGAQQNGASPPPQSANPLNETYLAYRYGYSFQLPTENLTPIMRAHRERCVSAGPELCQLLSSNSSGHDDFKNGSLHLRAEPSWLEDYRAYLGESIESEKGKIINSSVSAEDLTRSILDTQARLKHQNLLRERLEGHLSTRNAELKDLLSLERELARVQGQIESADAMLKTYKTRISMSELHLSYTSRAKAVSTSAIEPITQALSRFVRTISESIAAVIYFIAAILPWFIFIILPLIFLLRWLMPRLRRSRKSASKNGAP